MRRSPLRRGSLAGFAALVASLAPASVLAADRSENPSANPLRGEFTIGKDGRLIVLPVTLNKREVRFLLDTGASRSAVDSSFKGELGQSRGQNLLQTPSGRKLAETFDWPDARLGNQVFRSALPILSIDLDPLRRATNEKIYGVIGMDVLGPCRVQIDFDRGLIRFLEGLPDEREELGAKVRLELADDGSPFIAGYVGRETPEYFLIDTGAQGNSLTAASFDALLASGAIRAGNDFTSMTIAGELQGERGRLGGLTVGPFTHRGIRVARVNVSSLGLRYLSRFLVTFDFPGQALYLQKGPIYQRPEPQATSGLMINWTRDGKPIVASVRRGGPAESAGIQADDVLTRVENRRVEDYDQFSLRQLLTSQAGRRVSLVIQRGKRELKAELVLAED